MKKLALTALAAALAVVGLASTASADSRNGDDEWRHNRQHDGGNWDRRRYDDRDNDGWRHNDRRWRRHHHPRFVYRPQYRDDYCFVKKVRVYDDWGDMYIKRVRVCR